MEITLATPTPFAATVRTNRSAKAEKGTPVLVAHIFDGNYGACAVCHTDEGERLFLSLGNLVHEGPADPERVAALDAERAAHRAKSERRVEIGEPSWENDRCVAVDWTAEYIMDSTLARTVRGGTKRVRLFFPRTKRDGTPLFENGSVPGWLWDAKLREKRDELPQGFDLTERW